VVHTYFDLDCVLPFVEEIKRDVLGSLIVEQDGLVFCERKVTADPEVKLVTQQGARVL